MWADSLQVAVAREKVNPELVQVLIDAGTDVNVETLRPLEI
jgi:hypothetical protein